MRDSERFSIIHDMNSCLYCGSPDIQIHECFPGTANRQKSIQNGLCVALCDVHHYWAHHSKEKAMELKRIGKRAFLDHGHTEEEFFEIFGRNYED